MKYADLSQVLYFVKVYPIAPTTSMDPYPTDEHHPHPQVSD